MNPISRRFLFVLGAASSLAPRFAAGQTTGAAAPEDNRPACSATESLGQGWSVSCRVESKDDTGRYSIFKSIRYSAPSDEQSSIRSLSFIFTYRGSAPIGANMSATTGGVLDQRSNPDRFTSTAAGLLRVTLGGIDLSATRAKHEQAAKDGRWSVDSTIFWLDSLGPRILSALDAGGRMQTAVVGPVSDERAALILRREFDLTPLRGVAARAERMSQRLVGDAERQICKPTPARSGCYLTTVCCGAIGLADDCAELRILRRFRDGWLAKQPGGSAEIAEYGRVAPGIAARIESSPQRDRIARWLYIVHILPSILLILAGRRQAAWRRYRRMVLDLADRFPDPSPRT